MPNRVICLLEGRKCVPLSHVLLQLSSYLDYYHNNVHAKVQSMLNKGRRTLQGIISYHLTSYTPITSHHFENPLPSQTLNKALGIAIITRLSTHHLMTRHHIFFFYTMPLMIVVILHKTKVCGGPSPFSTCGSMGL